MPELKEGLTLIYLRKEKKANGAEQVEEMSGDELTDRQVPYHLASLSQSKE